jgi:hypothetical protein
MRNGEEYFMIVVFFARLLMVEGLNNSLILSNAVKTDVAVGNF